MTIQFSLSLEILFFFMWRNGITEGNQDEIVKLDLITSLSTIVFNDIILRTFPLACWN